MNISRRTLIIAGAAILAVIAALASLYFEKEGEIKLLVEIEDPAKIVIAKKIPVDITPLNGTN